MKKFLLPLLSVLFVFPMVLRAQVPGFFMKEPAKKVEIPFYVSNNLIIVPLSVNGHEPINFLIDTGVKTNLLFSKTIGDQMGLFYTRKIDLVGADGQTVLTASVSPNNPMELGPLKGNLQTMLVLDEDFFELEMVIGTPVYGVIGYEFFKYNPVKIDYDRGVLTFYGEKRMKWRPLGYKKIPMKVENGKPYIEGKVKQLFGEDIQGKMLIDLGANHGLLLNPETSNKIQLPPQYLESALGRSLGGDLFGYVGRVKSLNIGGLKFKNLIASFPEETEFSYVIRESGRNGSIGSEIWGRTKIIIDYRRDRLLMKRGESFATSFEFDMSGITPKMLPTEEKRFYVAGVRYGSPAFLAGVREGDEIIAINRIPLDFWELSDLIKLFRSDEGKDVILNLKRYRNQDPNDFEEVESRFKLKKQI